MQAWLSLESLTGIAIAAAFAIVALRDLRLGVFAYAVLGAVPFLEIGAFAGKLDVQGLVLGEVLATVLIGAWVLRPHALGQRLAPPFERWLFLLLFAALASFVASLLRWDPAVDPSHLNPLVSVGQLLLFAWPIGTYFVAAHVTTTHESLERLTRLIILLALPQVAIPFVEGSESWLSWSYYFGLVAAPLCVARCFTERGWFLRVGYVFVALLPVMRGLIVGKAFLYAYVTVAVAAILWMKARRLLVMLVPMLLAVYLLVLLSPGRSMLPEPLQRLVAAEEAQASWGGRAGRDQLARDTIAIWSRFPLLGVGPGNSYPYMIKYSVIGTPHSQYLNLLLELGLVGICGFVGFVASTIRFGARLVRQATGTPSEAFVLGWYAAFCGMAVGALTGDFLLHSVRNGGLRMFSGFYLHWVLLGLAVGTQRLAVAQDAPATWQPASWTTPPAVDWRQLSRP